MMVDGRSARLSASRPSLSNHVEFRTESRRAAPCRARLSRVSDARQGRHRGDQAAGQPARPRARLFARRRGGVRGDRRRPGQRLSLHLARQPGRGDHQRHRRARPRRHRPARRQAGDGGQGRPVQEVRRHRRLRHRGQREEPRQADRPDRRARADLRRHQPRGHQGAGLLLRRARAALADEDPGVPRRPARHRDRRRRRRAERAQGERQEDRRGQARHLGRGRCGARVPRPPGQARHPAPEHLGHRPRRRRLPGAQGIDGRGQGRLRPGDRASLARRRDRRRRHLPRPLGGGRAQARDGGARWRRGR